MSITVNYCENTEELYCAKKLFGEIFSVSEFAEKFYSIIEQRDDVDVILGKYNDAPVSVIHVIRSGDVSYIYGAGVLSKYRLKGVFRILIAETVKMCIEKGDKLIFMVPQESFHYDIYKKFDINKEVCKNLYELTQDPTFETETVTDIPLLYSLYKENGKSPLCLPYELFELYIKESDRKVEFIKDKDGVCGYMISENGSPYEIYCRKDGFFRITGKDVFALAVENGKTKEEIYEAVYLD